MAKNQGLRATALYERLSKDDELQGESNSISNQKKYLEDYARTHEFRKIQHYTDDGYTGRNFNRPGFQKMLKEIEDGNIETVIVKDMSRLGRNYLQVGYYTEILFPQKDVRFLAINNSVDSDNPMNNDFAPFLNIMNEWYAKDTSNKIKSVFEARMNEGKRCSGSIPYGYNRLPDDKQTLVVDPVASEVVRKIFDYAAKGRGPTWIARQLKEEKTLIPSAYTAKYHPEQNNNRVFEDPYRWRPNTVADILDRREYLGHTVLRKTVSVSFKTEKRRSVDKDDMLVFLNTHEAIIDEETWNKAQKFREKERQQSRMPYGTFSAYHKLCGFLFCADCGHRMTLDSHKQKNGKRYFSFRCGRYASDQLKCDSHYISADAVETLILHMIQRIGKRVIEDEIGFAHILQKEHQAKTAAGPSKKKSEYNKAKSRFSELDELIRGLYENYVAGILPERQYRSLIAQYDVEQTKLDKRIKELSEELKEEKEKPVRIDRFIEVIKRYKEPKELTEEMLRDLVNKVYIYQATGKGKKREQKIEIEFNFIGLFDLAQTTKEKVEVAKAKKSQEEEKALIKKAKARERGQAYRDKKKAERLAENEGHLYPKKVCPECGKEFWPKSSRAIYCSTECAYAHDRKRILDKRKEEKGNHIFRQKNCIICGKPFWPVNGQEVMCSPECKKKHRAEKQNAYYHEKVSDKLKAQNKAERERVMAENEGHLIPKSICEYCGEEFWPTKQGQKYCSKECGNKAFEMRNKGRDPAEKEGHRYYKRNCVVCGKEFWPTGANSLTCSEECQKQRIREKHKNNYEARKAVS